MAGKRDDRVDDDLDDERPSKPKRRREDDDRDDYDDRPQPKKGMSVGLIIGIVVGVMFLISVPCIAVLIALLLPATQKVREAAARANDANNMKQIALAAHNYESATGEFPGPFLNDNGKINRNMSWRVSMLPYIEEEAVFRMINKSAAWDDPSNRAATSMLIKPYKSAWDAGDTTPNTPYQAFVGPGAIFDDRPGLQTRISNVTDGTSNTILFVHAQQQVPWAAPRDLPFNPNQPLPPLGHVQTAKLGFHVCMADGSVRWMLATTQEATLKGMITKSGGEGVQIP